ncbi:MAG: NAD(P)H-dependent oxidoreductase [Spirochaetia bacterium]|nr:NAD(P)H-dependent oxidoreductase [Spirochaetia bacterium]
MKLVIIHGSPRRKNTFHTVQRCISEISAASDQELSLQEFFLPSAMKDFCRGCLKCITTGETACPHADQMQQIVEAMCDADGLILSSPVYVMSVSGCMKNFLDHGAYLFLNHRSRAEMFSKKALIVSTTAGAGLRRCLDTMDRVLRFWGVNRVYRIGIIMHAESWDDMPPVRRARLERKISRISAGFARDLASGKVHRPYLMQKIMFLVSKRMIRLFAEDSPDRIHWEEQGLMHKRWYI